MQGIFTGQVVRPQTAIKVKAKPIQQFLCVFLLLKWRSVTHFATLLLSHVLCQLSEHCSVLLLVLPFSLCSRDFLFLFAFYHPAASDVRESKHLFFSLIFVKIDCCFLSSVLVYEPFCLQALSPTWISCFKVMEQRLFPFYLVFLCHIISKSQP